jgi:hypothetical protein
MYFDAFGALLPALHIFDELLVPVSSGHAGGSKDRGLHVQTSYAKIYSIRASSAPNNECG